VEFTAAERGKRALTSHNVIDGRLRESIEADTATYDSYCFGGLDPFRVHASPAANRCITYPLGRGSEDLAALNRALWGTRHRLRCEIETVSAGEGPGL
jgi:hypothetical protein